MAKSVRPPSGGTQSREPKKLTSQSKISASASAARLHRQGVLSALRACENKKAGDIALLELEKGSSAFTDYFVICSGTNPRQIQAIADDVQEQLARDGMRPLHVEGYKQADWVLLDYVDFVVHIFSESARKFYDLERLWKSARRVELRELKPLAAKSTGTVRHQALGSRNRPATPRKKVK